MSEKTKTSSIDAAIEVKNFSKHFGSLHAVEDASFSISKKSIHGFIGPNGSGKTTSIKTLIGAYKPTGGSLLVNDFKAGTERAKAIIGYIPEKASFPKHLNARDFLIEMAVLSNVKRKEAKKKAIKYIKDMGLEKFAKKKPVNFSSGMQKKLLLAQALMAEPEILIFDEPAANLDPSARKELFDQILGLRNQGKSVFISSHVMSELEKVIDEVTFIYFGKVLFTGKVEDFSKNSHLVYVKSKDNKKLIEYLKKHKIKVGGDIATEFYINDKINKNPTKLMAILLKSKIEIVNFRSQDLQSAYEELVIKTQHVNHKSKGANK